MRWTTLHGDSLVLLPLMPANSVDALVCDPPAGIDFMNRDWDCFRRRHNPNDVGRENVFGRTSAAAPASYTESRRDNFIAAMTEVFWDVCRVLKPGAHGFVWAIPRTSHWMATALEDAGFEIRDIVHHLYGQGMPKSLNVSAAIDKTLGQEGLRGEPKSAAHAGWIARGRMRGEAGHEGHQRPWMQDAEAVEKNARAYIPASEAAQAWDGWGTALKPACEHWILVRKPLAETSIARNVLRYRTGGLNIDACRVERSAEDVPGWHTSGAKGSEGYRAERCPDCAGGVACGRCNGTGWINGAFVIRDMSAQEIQDRCGDKGRWPPNAVLSEESAAALDERVGPRKGGTYPAYRSGMGFHGGSGTQGEKRVLPDGGPSRYFPAYFPKPSRAEREAGLDAIEPALLNRVNPGGLEHEPRFAPVAVKNNHPTVKGVALMQYLCRLCCPPDGLILDPFMGSGTTGCAAVLNGQRFIGIEQDDRYHRVAELRIAHWSASRTGDPAP